MSILADLVTSKTARLKWKLCTAQHVPHVSYATLFETFFVPSRIKNDSLNIRARKHADPLWFFRNSWALLVRERLSFQFLPHAVVKYSGVSKERTVEVISNFISPNSIVLKMEAVLHFLTSEILNTMWYCCWSCFIFFGMKTVECQITSLEVHNFVH